MTRGSGYAEDDDEVESEPILEEVEDEPVLDELEVDMLLEGEDEDDLEDLGIAAAHKAISASEAALKQAEQATMLLSEAEAAPLSRWFAKRERLMAILMLLNLVLLGVVAALPDLFRSDDTGLASDTREPQEQSRDDNLYEEAMLASRRGDYSTATKMLKRLLERTPDMDGVQRRLVYGQLAYNLLRDGRQQEAEKYADRIERIRVQTTLPEDLVRAARRAHRSDRGADMRRCYARLLLQQDRIPSEMRDVIAEAHLRIGDSYRLEAEVGEKKEGERE